MKGRITAAALLMAAGAALPAQAQMGGRGGGGDYGPTPHASVPSDERVAPVSRDAVSIAQDLRLQGKCDKALAMLRRLAERGPGFEISQFDLGLCLFDLAKPQKDAQAAAQMRGEAAQWVLRAANAGFAKAQAKAVVLYLDAMGLDADPVEAEKWAILYHGNAMRFSIGLPDIAPELESRLDTALNDKTRAEAEARANAWTPTASVAEE